MSFKTKHIRIITRPDSCSHLSLRVASGRLKAVIAVILSNVFSIFLEESMAKYGPAVIIGATIVILLIVSYFYTPYTEGFAGTPAAEFTMYYVDWCPHCTRAKPVFNEFMGNGTVLINGKAVKCSMVNPEKTPEAVKGLDIKGFPSFYLSTNGKLVEFNGPRTADGFMEFLKTQIL